MKKFAFIFVFAFSLLLFWEASELESAQLRQLNSKNELNETPSTENIYSLDSVYLSHNTSNSTGDDWFFNQGNGSYVPGSTTTIQNIGTGINWNANFRRNNPTSLINSHKVTFDFYVDQKDSKTYLGVTTDSSNHQRLMIADLNGALFAQIFQPGQPIRTINYQLLSASDFQANTWYSGSITLDDQNGFLVEVHQRDDLSINGSFRDINGVLASGRDWIFRGITWQYSVFLENYLEETVSLPAPTQTPYVST